MRFRRYCVTVMDNWTPLREFWTLEGAKEFYRQHRACANVFKWEDGFWHWMCGARDLHPDRILSPHDAENLRAGTQSRDNLTTKGE